MRLGFATIVLVVLEVPALAGPSAEELYDEGQRAYDSAAYATAVVKWTQSYELSSEPGLLFNLAQAYRLNRDCAQALATYKRFVEADPASEQRILANDFIRELEPKCGASSQPPRVERPHTTPPRTLKIAGLVTGGSGVAIVATGLLFGRRAGTLGDEVSRACDQMCDWAAQKDKDARGRRYATTGYVLDAVGVAAIAGGAVMYYFGIRGSSVVVAPKPGESGAIVSWSGSW